MKIISFFLFGLLAVGSGCSKPRPLTLPEISPPLIQEEVFAWSGEVAGNELFSCADGLGWIDSRGKIVTWNVEKRTFGREIPLPFAVADPPFVQGDYVLVKNPATEQLLVFNLATLRVQFELRDLEIQRVLAVSGDSLVYLDGRDLVVYSWRNPSGIFRLPAADAQFFNCHFFPDRILILGSRNLYVFWKQNGRFQQSPLALEAVSEFLCHGEHIYYGSRERLLVRLSLPQNKVIWKLKLGQLLERRPFIFSRTIVVSPADHTVLQFNERGTLQGWQALQSTLQFPLVSMADHLAACLLNREIKFINPRSQHVTVFKMTGRPTGKPLAYGHDLYFFQTVEKEQKLQRVGNLYGIEVTRKPDKANWLGASLTFSLVTQNLLDPRLRCVILDEMDRPVFTKNPEPGERAQIVWMPERAGRYRLRVTADALNRAAEKEIAFPIFDPQDFFLRLRLHF